MAMEYLHGQMVENILAFGKMVNKLELEFTISPTGR